MDAARSEPGEPTARSSRADKAGNQALQPIGRRPTQRSDNRCKQIADNRWRIDQRVQDLIPPALNRASRSDETAPWCRFAKHGAYERPRPLPSSEESLKQYRQPFVTGFELRQERTGRVCHRRAGLVHSGRLPNVVIHEGRNDRAANLRQRGGQAAAAHVTHDRIAFRTCTDAPCSGRKGGRMAAAAGPTRQPARWPDSDAASTIATGPGA